VRITPVDRARSNERDATTTGTIAAGNVRGRAASTQRRSGREPRSWTLGKLRKIRLAVFDEGVATLLASSDM